ncbi:MAG: hypothetical protein ACK5KO_04790 [Arachnia sp.]
MPVTRRSLLCVAVGTLVPLSACSVGAPAFSDAAEADAYLRQALEDKYGTPFVVTANEEYSDGFWNRYSAEVAPVSAPEQTASARVAGLSGRLSDGWAVWQYFGEIAAVPIQVCDEMAGELSEVRFYPHMRQSSQTWTPETHTVSEFVEGTDAFVNVQVVFASNDVDIVAPLLHKMIIDLNEDPYGFNLNVGDPRELDVLNYHYTKDDPIPSLDDLILHMKGA